MSEIIRFRVQNEADEYLSNLIPVAWSKNIKDALVDESDIFDIDYDFVKAKLMSKLETILTKSAYSDNLYICVYTDTDVPFFEICINKKCVRGSVDSKVSVSKDVMDCLRFVLEQLVNEVSDIFLRSLSSATLSKTLDEMKSALGISGTSLSEDDDLDALCEKISKETKAEVVKPKENLKDYVCNDLLRQELEEIKDFFENRKIYVDAKVDLPKGILFKGPWGTGKTYAARCIAGSVDCYFMTCTASALQGMYIGSGADNIRNMFKGAKLLAEKSKKGVIIFIDELDSFGDRANRSGGASGEEDRTLNQLLAEMSGFTDDNDIMVLAATNFPERLDSALMRSGRFGRQITIDYPDDEERLSLVKFYYNKINIPIVKDVSFEEISNLTQGLTPADIKEIANESGILSIRNKATEITLDVINEAINKVITKNIRHPDNLDVLDLVTAHECGHVITEIIYNKTYPIKVTNYAYGDAGGFTQPAGKMSGIISKDRMINEVRMLLGGRAAEEVICGYITSGASSDLSKAKEILKSYFKYYNFEKYDVSKLDQVILDKLHSIYEELVDKLKIPEVKDVLHTLIDKLKSNRVLYTEDIVVLTGCLGGIKIC